MVVVLHAAGDLCSGRDGGTIGRTTFVVPEFYQRSSGHVRTLAVLFSGVRFDYLAHLCAADVGAPRILRRERQQITQYKIFTAVGMALGLGLDFVLIGANQFFVMFPLTVLLFTLPIAILWAYLALVLVETDYDDERVWSFLTEIGAGERLDHRHHGYYVLVMVPVSALIFYWMMQNQWIYYWFADSTLIAMFNELINRATGRVG